MHSASARRVATWAQILAGVYLLVMFTNLSLRFWSTQGDGRPRSPLYGIWEVVELRLDGQTMAPADADYDRRWRRVIFDTPDMVAIQRTDDSVAHYGAAFEAGGGRLRLSKGRSRTWRADFGSTRGTARRTCASRRDGRPQHRGPPATDRARHLPPASEPVPLGPAAGSVRRLKRVVSCQLSVVGCHGNA